MRTPCSLMAACAVVVLASCGTSTIPTPADMDRYYAKAEQMAQHRIADLERQRRREEITEAEFAAQYVAIRGRIMNQATELAWARHQSIEAQKVALGIPTGDHPVQVQVPGVGNGESFYRRAGQTGGENFNSNTPYGGSVLGGPNRGERPIVPPVKQPGGEPDPTEVPASGM